MNIEAFFKVSYGLYIIGSAYDGKRSGYVANTAFQVTAEPARFAISCSKNNYWWNRFPRLHFFDCRKIFRYENRPGTFH